MGAKQKTRGTKSLKNKAGGRNTKGSNSPRIKERRVFVDLVILYIAGVLSGFTLNQWELISGFLIAISAPVLNWIEFAIGVRSLS